MLDQHALDLGWRDPDAADLHHVVVAAQELPVAIFGAGVDVAGAEPLAHEVAAGRVGAAPVSGRDRVAPHVQLPGHVRFSDRRPGLVQQLGLIAADQCPAGAGALGADLVRQEDVERLGRSDSVEHRRAVLGREPAVQLGRQRLSGGDGGAHRAQCVLGNVGVEQRCDEAGTGEEQRRPVLDEEAGHAGRRRPRRIEHCRGTDRERERQRIAESVSEEQLGHREAAVVGTDVQNRFGIGGRGGLGIGMAVHDPFGKAGRPRAVQPEGR